MCFPVNFAKFLITPVFTEHLRATSSDFLKEPNVEEGKVFDKFCKFSWNQRQLRPFLVKVKNKPATLLERYTRLCVFVMLHAYAVWIFTWNHSLSTYAKFSEKLTFRKCKFFWKFCTRPKWMIPSELAWTSWNFLLETSVISKILVTLTGQKPTTT